MPVRIILLETSTSLCSAALLEGDEITAVRHSGEPRAHASMTAPYVKEILDERGLKVSDCDAVCLSMGPGSYTGLRVGSSTAKGLCFGGGIPLLAVGTLDVLAAQAIEAGLPEGCEYIVPMIDARRMEVYTALYSAEGQRLTEVAPKVVDSSFADMLMAGAWRTDAPGAPVRKGQSRSGGISTPSNNPSFPLPLTEPSAATVAGSPAKLRTPATDGILFIGDGVKKCEEILAGENRWFRQECPTAEAMKKPALKEFNAGNFRDIAYFEPFYLKDFVATVSKKLF
ncbi:MAG: tRNA (adenosine(37)-N6)-threonylcarbamoyltransferase complex dimerization subunit type 1 TsaB [Bacteroidales bacterium]|nr:tRNA (adenosine(37)-N6)-threonylcarbamoyltransferase complex dimerization subunit type 1 TsaB [Bacteroidales bacterium]